MPTPYEEISNERSNREVVKTDANLAQDSLQLGGIDAEEYALKSYVQEVDRANSKRDQKYTDDKIKQLSEDLKGYTDTAIGNQDFTDFTRKRDLDTVQEQLKNTINQTKIDLQQGCEESCKTNLENAKKYTDEKYNELFQSVSDGKGKIAEAITDKGVTTSATDSYDKMADNISKIETGLDTSDATATSKDISYGKTAYAREEKITGTYIPPTLPNTPTYGTDTSDGTANANDIRIGKIAYSNGQRLEGTLEPITIQEGSGSSGAGNIIPATQVEELYSLAEDEYDSSSLTGYTHYIESMKLEPTGVYDVDSSGKWIVNAAKTEQTDENQEVQRYILSRYIYNGAIVTEQNQYGEVKRYLWSFDELGLDTNKDVDFICIGSPGFNGDSKDALLCIIQGINIHLYRYSLYNGYIGFDYQTERIGMWDVIQPDVRVLESEEAIDIASVTRANQNPNIFAFAVKFNEGHVRIYMIYVNNYGLIEQSYSASIQMATYGGGIPGNHRTIKFSVNDTYIYGDMEHMASARPNYGIGWIADASFLCHVGKHENSYSILGEAIYVWSGQNNFTRQLGPIAVLPNETQVMLAGYLYDINYSNNTITLTKASETQFVTGRGRYAGFSRDGTLFYKALLKETTTTYNPYINIYEVDFKSTSKWEPIASFTIPLDSIIDMATSGVARQDVLKNSLDLNWIVAGNTTLIKAIKPLSNTIIGVKYKNKTFYEPGILEKKEVV